MDIFIISTLYLTLLFSKKKKTGVLLNEKFISTFSELELFEQEIKEKNIKTNSTSYGTIIYIPPACKIDFGKEIWPPVELKKNVSPRMLLISQWTDAKLGFLGGGREKNETKLETLNREVYEELGSEVKFTDDEYCFSNVNSVNSSKTRISHIYAKITNDLDWFNSLLINFHSNSTRDAYVDEVFTSIGLPIWLEGPISADQVVWGNNVWGLPRLLTGGCLNQFTRDNVILLLLKTRVVSIDLMKRIFELSSDKVFPGGHYLSTFNNFIKINNAESMIEKLSNNN